MQRTLLSFLLVSCGLTGLLAAEDPLYLDRTGEWGLDFTHRSGSDGRLLMPEMMGPGAGLVDYDYDGDLDVYLVQGRSLAPGNLDEHGIPRAEGEVEDRLYRNDRGVDGAVRLVDVSARALGEPQGGYGMGVAVGDPDGDGDLDLVRTAFGTDVLLQNAGDGTFRGTTDPDRSWSTSASFVDIDGDTDLDLYVARYLEYSLSDPPTCFATTSAPDYCGPSDLTPAGDRLLLNQGGGRFVDGSDALGGAALPGLGVAVLDGDLDGRPEIFVANDGTANHLWRWAEGRGLQDLGELVGVAYNRFGQPEASMGIAVGDPNTDGRPDLLVTHLTGETDTLYVNETDLFFDRTLEYGLGPPTLPWTGFGTVWVDPDLDGKDDLVVLHGAVRLPTDTAARGPRALAQPPQLLLRSGPRFALGPAAALPLPEKMVGRGLAVGDVDGDGLEDLLVTDTDAPARLLAARPPEGRTWLGARIERLAGNPALGAAVRPGGAEAPTRWVATDGSYLSARDPRVVLSLRGAERTSIELRWPSGERMRWNEAPAGRTLVYREDP